MDIVNSKCKYEFKISLSFSLLCVSYDPRRVHYYVGKLWGKFYVNASIMSNTSRIQTPIFEAVHVRDLTGSK